MTDWLGQAFSLLHREVLSQHVGVAQRTHWLPTANLFKEHSLDVPQLWRRASWLPVLREKILQMHHHHLGLLWKLLKSKEIMFLAKGLSEKEFFVSVLGRS